MSIAVASDHAGYPLKKLIIEYLTEKKIDFHDYGVFSEERVDYPDFGVLVAREVVAGKHQFGIIICGTGIGISMAANKITGARAALCCNEYMAEMARRHNNANLLALGGRTTTIDLAVRMIDVFLNTEFEGGRHTLRVDKIHALTER
ncbi:MAG: ribose 5-phosphate isomerase B [Calditrichaeota bacterium]|nr:MAG: ribose 5-phosphate isomerase B [Calditrichota bacterium]